MGPWLALLSPIIVGTVVAAVGIWAVLADRRMSRDQAASHERPQPPRGG